MICEPGLLSEVLRRAPDRSGLAASSVRGDHAKNPRVARWRKDHGELEAVLWRWHPASSHWRHAPFDSTSGVRHRARGGSASQFALAAGWVALPDFADGPFYLPRLTRGGNVAAKRVYLVNDSKLRWGISAQRQSPARSIEGWKEPWDRYRRVHHFALGRLCQMIDHVRFYVVR